MKIALITSFFEPIGGQENVTRLLFNALRGAGHNVFVITTRNLWFDCDNVIALKHLNSIPRKILIPGNLLTDYLMSVSIVNTLKRINPDVIHIQDEFVLPAAILANKHLGIPCVCSCHNNLFIYSKKDFSIREKTFSLFLRIRKQYYIRCLKKVDYIISVSNYIRKELLPLGIDSNKIHTIYNVHLCLNHKCNNVKSTASSSQIVLFALGRLVWYKGFEVILKAIEILFKQNSPVKLVIAGCGPEMSHLKALIAVYNLEPFAVLAGHISEDEKVKFYYKSDIVLLPSIYPDPSPLVSMEAMDFGKPIIASNIGGIPEMVFDGVNGFLVPPNNPKKIAESILKLTSNWQLRKSMGNAGRNILYKKFKNQQLIDQTINLYNKVVFEYNKFK